MIHREELESRYGYHKGTEITIPQHREVRSRFLELAQEMELLLPEGRAKAIMHTTLEEASMWANKAVAEQAPLDQ